MAITALSFFAKQFRLVSGNVLQAHQEALAKVLFEMPQSEGKYARFEVFSNGYFVYENLLWEKNNRFHAASPQTKEKAVEIVTKWLGLANERLNNAIEQQQLPIELETILLRKSLKIESITPIYKENTKYITHWNFKYFIELSYNPSYKAKFYGQHITLQVAMTVVGMEYSSRIIENKPFVSALVVSAPVESVSNILEAQFPDGNDEEDERTVYPILPVIFIAQNDMALLFWIAQNGQVLPATQEGTPLVLFKDLRINTNRFGIYKTVDLEGNCHFTIRVKVINTSRIKDEKTIENYIEGIKKFVESSLNGVFNAESEEGKPILDENGEQKTILCSATFEYEMKLKNEVDKKKDFIINLTNTKTNFLATLINFEIYQKDGETSKIGEPIVNWIDVAISGGKNKNVFYLPTNYINHTAFHELLHAMGLKHPWDEAIGFPIREAMEKTKKGLLLWIDTQDDTLRDLDSEKIIEENIMTTSSFWEALDFIDETDEDDSNDRESMPNNWQNAEFNGVIILPSQLAKIINNKKIVEP